MSSSANIFRTADAAFHHAIELFFGMNPSSPWWVLVVFYLARHRKLRVVENASPSRYTLAHMDYSYGEISFSPQIISGWKERGIHDLCLEADIDTDSVEAEFIFNVVNTFYEKISHIFKVYCMLYTQQNIKKNKRRKPFILVKSIR